MAETSGESFLYESFMYNVPESFANSPYCRFFSPFENTFTQVLSHRSGLIHAAIVETEVMPLSEGDEGTLIASHLLPSK